MNAPTRIDAHSPLRHDRKGHRHAEAGRAGLLHSFRRNSRSRRAASSTGSRATRCTRSRPIRRRMVLEQVWAAGIRHFDTASLRRNRDSSRTAFPTRIAISWRRCALSGAGQDRVREIWRHRLSSSIATIELDKLLAETRQPEEAAHLRALATPLGGALLELSSKFGTTPDEAAKLLKRVAGAGRRALPHLPCRLAMPVAVLLCPGDRDGAAHRRRWPGVEIAALDIGGGFPGPYTGNDVPPYHWYFDTIKEALETLADPKICR